MSIKTTNRIFSIFTFVIIPILFLLFGLSNLIVADVPYGISNLGISLYPADDGKDMGAAIGAGLCCIGMLGTGIGQGVATGKAVEALSRNPEAESKIRVMLFTGLAITESAALYCFVLAIMLIFVF